MRIEDVVRRKGQQVVTIGSDSTVGELIALLTRHRIGAVVVSDGEGRVDGIVSERDLIPLVEGQDSAGRLVRDVMVRDVVTCTPADDLEALARTMTERRVRHIPVVEDGAMVAIVSIGDVVKHRLDELQAERDQLASYVHG
ncbi:Inosine-5'-monophosphate dehydrogenase [Actinomycetales bacterium JB111]|nr:Inosine-5'-monophosphate dehydrogenase [Actinomycetales bacterium JB111]